MFPFFFDNHAMRKNQVKSYPVALLANVLYNGQPMSRKDVIDDVVLRRKLINFKKQTTGVRKPYIVEDPSTGERFRFDSMAEKKYIDTLLKKINNGANVEMEHISTIQKIKTENPSSEKAAAFIAADHIEEDPQYYQKLKEAKLEHGGPIQKLDKGTVLEGPSHENGGIEVVVNNKPVAEAEGGEIVINAENSKKYCKELSEINQRHGNGRPLNCDEDDRSDFMRQGGKVADACPVGTQIQSLLFLKKQFTKRETTEWLKKHDFSNTTDLDETESFYRARQEQPEHFTVEGFRTIKIADGIKAIIGCPVMEQGGKVELTHKKIKKQMKKAGKIYNEEFIIGNIDDSEMPEMKKGGSIEGGPLYTGANASRQIKKELKEKFPNIKFSVRYSSYSGGDSIRVSWNFGPTTAEVDSIINKYQYGSFDGMTDSYTVNDDNQKFVDEAGAVRDIGGVKYVFSERSTYLNNGQEPNEQWDKETSIQLLIAKDLVAKQGKEWKGHYTPMYDNSNETAKDIAYRILRQNAFDTDDVRTYDGLEATGVTSGFEEEFYKIKYNSDKVTTNPKGEETKKRNDEWERTRPEREAKAAAEKAEYEKREEERRLAISQLNVKQYEMLDDQDYFIKKVQWPSLNKNSSLDEYKAELEKDISQGKDITQKALVEQVIIANDKDFNVLSNNLLTDLPQIWKGIGGIDIPLSVLVQYDISEKEWNTFSIPENKRKLIFPFLYRKTTLVFNSETKESFIVDTQGYDYARYVGFTDDMEAVENILLNIKLEDEPLKENDKIDNISKQDASIKPSNTAPMNLNKPTSWDQLPQSWKTVKKLPAIPIDNTPYDKNLQKLLDPFLSTDSLRPVMQGAFFDENGITATDAHKLIHLPYANKEFSGIYSISNKIKMDESYLKGDQISGKYPNYEAVIPNEYKAFRISVLKIKTFISAIFNGKLTNNVTHQVVFAGPKDEEGKSIPYGYNGEFLIQILNACLMLGKEYVYFGISAPNKALIVAFTENAATNAKDHIGKETIFLLMPVHVYYEDETVNKMPIGAVDIDWEKEFRIAYDLITDSIYNYDGTVANFDYGLTKATESDLTTNQDKMVAAFKPKVSSIPIIEGVLVKDGKLFATDLETTVIINGVNKPNNVYNYINDALVEYNSKANESENFVDVDFKEKEFARLGTVNRLELLFNLEKCNLCLSTDDLRPALKGVHFTKDVDADSLIIEATNAHIAFRNEIKVNTLTGIDVIVPSTKKLKVFLENVFDQDIEILVSGKHIIFKSAEAMVYSLLIDARYPDLVRVIPNEADKALTLDIKNLKECIKTITKEEKKKEITLGFKPIENGIVSIDLIEYPTHNESKVLRHLCNVEASIVQKNKTIKKNIFLGMPAMVAGSRNPEMSNNYYFGLKTDILESFIKITESNKLVIDFTSYNRALVLSESEFKQISEPVNIPKPTPKKPKQKDDLQKIAEQQDDAEAERLSKEKAELDKKASERSRKVKVAKAKAEAQKQRIRILALNKKDDKKSDIQESDLDKTIKAKFKHLSNQKLIDRANAAPDFKWDDEAYEIERRMKVSEGKFKVEMQGNKLVIIKDEE